MRDRSRGPGKGLGSAICALSLLVLSGCGSGILSPSLWSGSGSGPTSPVAAQIYSIDGTNNRVIEYTSDTSGSASQTGEIDLPAGLNASLLATDSQGQIYVGGYTTNVNDTEVLVYPQGSTGSATPSRTIVLETGKLTALAVDKAGQIYAAQLNVLASVNVYAAGANGVSPAIRVLNPSHFLYLNDVAVDSSYNVYVSGYNGGVYFIDTYSSSESGAASPVSTLIAPAGSYFGGIAVDDEGSIYAMEELTIVKFPAGSTGTPVPANSINLPGPISSYTAESYSNVLRRDNAGDLIVPVTMSNASASVNMVYGFNASQSGSTTPALQFTATNATVATPLGVNIPLAVF